MAVMLEDLLDKLAVSAGNNTEKGTAFEKLMASYLRTAPEFADRFEDVYLWQDWPERGNQHDHGIDIVARDTHTGGWCAVQCKFYDPNHHVNKGDIDAFLAASGKVGFTSRLIFSTAKDWGPTAEKILDNLQVPVVRIGLSDLLESKVDWSEVFNISPVPEFLPTTGKKTPRPHQRAAMKKVRDGLTGHGGDAPPQHDRGQLIMACGTGKTFIDPESLRNEDGADDGVVPGAVDPVVEPIVARVEAGGRAAVPCIRGVLRRAGRQEQPDRGLLGARPDLPGHD